MNDSIADHSAPSQRAARPRRGPITLLLDLFSSVWFGVLLLALIFVYCWLGSGGLLYPVGADIFSGQTWQHEFVRQRFEKTEMEWFSWWPFNTLLALLALSLITVTLRRIRLNLVNLGVWGVHAGIITLMIGCVIYFGRKVEGDVAVYRRQARITAPGAETPASLVLRPGASTTLIAGDKHYHVSVADLMPDYELRTGDDAGKTTYMAQLSVEGPDGSFIRQLLVGYPQYTQDVIPGMGRAIKTVGKRLVDEELRIALDYAPEEYFYLAHSAAIYARLKGKEDWTVHPIKGLPRYREHLPSRQDVAFARGDALPPLRPLDLEARPVNGANAVDGVRFRTVAYLPYATFQRRWVPGGAALNPVVQVQLRRMNELDTFEFVAFDPQRSKSPPGTAPVRFRWIETPKELDALTAPSKLRIRITAKDVDIEVPLRDLRAEGGYAVPGTQYVLSMGRLITDWMIAGGRSQGTLASVALVNVAAPGKRYVRAVMHPDASLSQDIDPAGNRHAELLNPDLQLSLIHPAAEEIVIIAGPEDVGLHVMLSDKNGEKELKSASLGDEVEFFDGHLGVRIRRLIARAIAVQKPAILPDRERNPKAGSQFSMIKVEVIEWDRAQSLWLPYSEYPKENPFGFFARSVTLADGRELELAYSRDRHRLPVPVALEEFQLETYPGSSKPRDYISRVRFLEDGTWSEPVQVRSNHPTAHRGLWFFQATWDPPEPQSGHAGMNYTGLGVGNREGVRIMLGGTILSIAGMIYAFYAKPVLKRRRRLAVMRSLAARQAPAREPALHAPAREPVTVADTA